RSIGHPRADEIFDWATMYGINVYFISTARRKSASSASSYSHGSRGGAPCVRVCDVNAPNAIQRRYRSRGARWTKPPTSWLQYVKPVRPNESPALSSAAIAWLVFSASPPQCTG